MTRHSRDARLDEPRNVLYLHTTSEVGGSDVSLLGIVEGLDRARFEPVVALPADGPLVARLEAAGCAVEVVPQMKKLTSRRGLAYLAGFALNYPFAVARLARLVRRRRIDLVHTNTIHNLYGVGAARVAGRPHVWHVREIVWQSAAVSRLERLLSRLADRVVVTSDAVGAMFKDRRGRPAPNVVKVPNGVDVRAFTPGPSGANVWCDLGLPDGAPLVGVACRLDAWKGVDVFLRAAAEVRRSVPGARFIVVGGAIVGQEAYERDLQRLAGDLGLGDIVRFAGWRYGPDQMPDVMRSLHVLALPSKEPEPFGLVLLEAMASGVPTVATDHGGPREICVAGETGLLVPPNDVPAMAVAIQTLLADPDRARRMGEMGRRRVEALYTRHATVSRLEALYDELLER
jgi:glycosyltransferase involved in cell wall biosynthesis